MPQIRRVAVDEFRAHERILAQEPVRAGVDELDGVVAPSARASRSMPMLCNAAGLRLMIAPPPRWVSM